jgi:hypothetical protein
MKNLLLFTLFFLNINYFCFAQEDDRVKKAEAIQIAYLTKELGLTPEEAQRFWPIFNNYKQELRAQQQNPVGNVIEKEEQIVNIRKKYRAEFKKVIPDDKRVNKIFTADKNFRDLLQKELQSRKNDGGVIKQKGKKLL